MHIETRLHPGELELLDAYAEAVGAATRTEALRDAVRRAARRTRPVGRIAAWRRRQHWQAQERGMRVHESDTVAVFRTTRIIADDYPAVLGEAALAIKAHAGCRTLFAVPRYALISEAQRLGLTDDTRPAPRGFTRHAWGPHTTPAPAHALA